MKITCFIEYRLDPFQLDKFEQYAENWGKIIPECGGELVGYFLPHEGSNDRAFGLISFESLADYEQYRIRLKKSTEGSDNFKFAINEQFIKEEKRSFLKIIPSTYQKPAVNTL